MSIILSIIQADLLAFFVLVLLIFSLLFSFLIIFKSEQFNTRKKWFPLLLMLFSLMGFPAVLDLMTTSGYTKYLAIIIFIILLIPSIVGLMGFVQKRPFALVEKALDWLALPFITGGLIVSAYLTYVEATSTTAVCGVGIPGCAEVQSSPYAVLFGFLPVALLGIIGYIGILASWLGKKFLPSRHQKTFGLLMWGLSFFGILFSIYLTYLEVYVLHATCTWCILAAVFMTLLYWISIQGAQDYFNETQDSEEISA